MRHFLLFPLCLCLTLSPTWSHAQSSIQHRIDAAAPGDTVVMDGGVHYGSLRVDRSIVLMGMNGAHLNGDEQAHVVTITANDVVLQGFTISSSGTQLEDDHAGVMVQGHRVTIRNNYFTDVLHGIYVKGKNHAHISGNVIEGPPTMPRTVRPDKAAAYASCSVPAGGGVCDVPLVSAQRGNGIHLWNAHHSTLKDNTVRRTRDGMYFSHSDHTDAAHNVIENVRYGLHFMYSDNNRFWKNVFAHNVSGSALMYSSEIEVCDNDFRSNRTKNGYGLLLQSVDRSTFRNNRLVSNMTGLYLENSSANMFEQNTVRSNFYGLRLTGSSMDNRFTRNVVHGNLQTAQLAGVSSTNAWSVDGIGNYWGKGGLLDIDQDGVSEMPRRVVDVLGSRHGAFPYTGLLASSPGIHVLAFALRRAPLPDVPHIVDPHPLMQSDASRTTGQPVWLGLLVGGLAAFLMVMQRLNA